MKINTFLVIVVIILGLLAGLQTFFLSYVMQDQKLFKFLASDPTTEELLGELGMPQQVYPAGAYIPELGWPSPKPREHEAWIYSIMTGKRFVVFVNRKQDRIEYVFVSSS